jgi:hypothetical protein
LGTHSIKAVYGGDTNFKSSTSAILQQVVNKGSSPSFQTSGVASAVTSVDLALSWLPNEPDLDGLIASLALEQLSAQTKRQQWTTR